MKPTVSLPASVKFAALAACLTLSASLPRAFAADPPTTPATPTTVPAPASDAASTTPPASPTSPNSPALPKPQIDASAMAILKKSQVATLAPKSYRAECWTTQTWDPVPNSKTRPTDYEMATLTAEKPNLMRYDAWEMSVDAKGKWLKQKALPTYIFVSDGKQNWMQFGATYMTNTNTKPDQLHTILEPWGGFYSADASPYGMTQYYQTKGQLLEVRADGKEAVEGVVCDKVFTHTLATYEGSSIDYRTTYYIAPDGLLRRQSQHFQFSGRTGSTRDAVLRHIQTNFTVDHPKTLFAYTPPKGVKSQEQMAAEQPKLLSSGVAAPEITAVDKDGAAVKLSDLRGKVVVVDFWASWCPPCKASMPHNQEVAKKLQGENVPLVLLAVDNGEDQPAFAAWVKAHPELDALRFVYANPKTADVSGKDYHVTGIPTQYIIDAQGVIRASFVGYGGPTDDLEKAIRAAMLPLQSAAKMPAKQSARLTK